MPERIRASDKSFVVGPWPLVVGRTNQPRISRIYTDLKKKKI
jgi:hypothetical protein